MANFSLSLGGLNLAFGRFQKDILRMSFESKNYISNGLFIMNVQILVLLCGYSALLDIYGGDQYINFWRPLDKVRYKFSHYYFYLNLFV